MIPDPEETIVAIAVAPGPGARGIVRLSGPRAIAVARDRFEGESGEPASRVATRQAGKLRVDGLRPPLPVALFLWPGPRSYTGQPVAEIHTAGSPPILDQIVAHCLARGARPAHPGEFTLRAFLAGRIDLTQAEAVLGVIQAENPAQVESALQQLAGGLAGPIRRIRDELADQLAFLEANLDFAEEPDVALLDRAELAANLAAAAETLAELAARLAARHRPEGLPRVVLIGPPNAGKSRLFNALAGGERAIVSPIAGTTRDYLSARVDCDGLPIELIDTAGEDAPADAVEAVAQSMRRREAERADLLLLCRAGPPTGPSPPFLKVWTKADLVGPRGEGLPTSGTTGEGLAALRTAIAASLRAGEAEGSAVAATSARCRDSLLRAGTALAEAAETAALDVGDEVIAVDLRLALEELGKVVGAIITEDLLDRIFGRFCIGK